MVYEPSLASAKIEQLKESFETELRNMEEAGEKLMAEHPAFSEQAQAMIRIARQKMASCSENMFSLALGADFQGGKSTTVNAMADGREICPRGNGGGGIRTSACAVQITCALDDHAASTIQWKSNEQLDIDLKYWTGDAVSMEMLLRDKSKNCEDVLKKIKEELCEDIDSTSLDKIQQTLLFLSYYDHASVRNWRKRNTFSAEEIISFLAFPSDNVSRWAAVQREIRNGRLTKPTAVLDFVRTQFSPENAMYLFIEIVNFSTPSEYLKAMGISVVDTPGLNMSDNDTRVALRVMESAAAIFYLFDGTKQLGEQDKQTLNTIKKAGLDEKVFFGINFRRPVAGLGPIENSILADLDSLGYNKEHQKRLLHYNALLAQRAKQGRLILSGQLDETSQKKIMDEAAESGCSVQSVKEAWIETTDSLMQAVKAEGFRDFYELGLCHESIEMVYRASKWEETMDAIFEYILKNRGRILLLDHVAKPVSNQLSEIESILRQKEADAKQNADDLNQKYKRAIQRYKDFKDECSGEHGKVAQWIKTDWDQQIAEDCYRSVYETCAEDAARKAVGRIEKKQTLLNKIGHLGTQALNKIKDVFDMDTSESRLAKECAAIVSEAVDAAAQPRMIKWQENFEQSTVYQNTVFASVVNLHRDIMALWSAKGMDDDEILKNLKEHLERSMPQGKFSTDSQTVVLSEKALSKLLLQDVGLTGSVADALKGMAGGYAAGVGITYIYLYILPADFIVPFAAEIIGGIMIIVAALVAKFSSEKRREKAREKMRMDLQAELDKAFHDSTNRMKIIQALASGDHNKKSPGMKLYREFYTAAFEEAISKCERILKKNAEEAEAEARRGDEARKKIADEAADIRKRLIAPIQERMAALEEKVKKICPETAL